MQCFHKGPALIAAPPAPLPIVHIGERVKNRVEVGTNGKTEILEVIAGIDHHSKLLGLEDSIEAGNEPCSADTAAQGDDAHFGGKNHKNMSSSTGRNRRDAPLGTAWYSRPRTITTGLPSLGLAHQQRGRGRQFIAMGHFGHLEWPTIEVVVAAADRRAGLFQHIRYIFRRCQGARACPRCRR